jgi:ABC-type phosphate transport system auxiliary subunit
MIRQVSAKAKWNKKKSCMESELADFEERLNALKQEMSEEDIIHSDLEAR